MSYGVHALTKILEVAVPLLQDFDIELTEAHHNKKSTHRVEHLSNFYDVIKELRENVTPVYDRHERNENALKMKLVSTQYVAERLLENMISCLLALMKQ